MRDAAQYLEEDIIEKYTNDEQAYADAKELFNNVKDLAKFEYDESIWILSANDKMICLRAWFGVLYCIKK